MTTIEIAKIKLAAGQTEVDLIAASHLFQEAELNRAPGFLRRELLKLKEGYYADLVHWENESAAKSFMEKAAMSPHCMTYFSVMDMDATDPQIGVEHYSSLAKYGKEV